MGSKSYNRIVMDFRSAYQQADQLERMSDKLRKMAEEQFEGVIRNVSTNWQGENASSYLAKCQTLKSNMLESASDLSKAAGTVRTIADNVYEAEMRAWRIAQTREGHNA